MRTLLLATEHSRGKVEESGLDYGYGQREELTKRLHNLLNDSYTDGFSVPKELIQNADDAGATEVCFMLDERENRDARSDLLGHNMASLQGPALWTYNDAPFKDEDFENIARLGAGTKEEDSSKVGRFGLGFNSVYNLTDVPIFISRHTMGMFDPHAKYLPKGAGLKLDFRRPVDREELTKRPNQFMPFQGVFGCQLRKRDQGDEDVFFEGTLFRFPLRTDEQAKESRIKSESYSESKRREFLRMLMDRAGSLLMFTQSVKKVQVYHLPSDSTDPGTAARLLTATRTSECVDLLTSSGSLCGTLLQGCTTSWFTDKDVKILEQVTIVVDVTDEAKSVCDVDKCRVQTRWKHAWATGIDDSATAAERQGRKGFVPLATVAVLVAEDSIQAVSDSPFGFYRTGHLFCFMPLPQEMVQMNLPVHVNGTFDLTSSRRSLQVLTEDDMRGTGSEWNAALFGDAVCRAYLTLLENVQAEAAKDKDYQRYYGLWPDSGQESLDQHFYRRLVSDNNKVFPVPVRNKWVAFQDAWFLDADFRESECGQLAWHAMNHFWDREGGLVDIPTYICRLIHRIGQGEAFQEKVITKEEFYEKFFFPNIDSDYWKSSVRDKLVHYALMQDNEEILDLVRTHACIPCEGTGKLEYPRRLLHPSKQASKLYRASEGRFPQGAESQKNADQVNFCQQEDLERLERLGMIVDDLPMDMVLERAESASTLLNEDEKRGFAESL
ncbi:hypothetical protein BaRGS_00016103 [Batillaria attramentaria]|uniref:Sacsin/Nov domain-containing protein n=1 Tax=Batillaria attramentaria TaxID=370345 RepID=A0ABD0L0N6_9CAEN